MSTFTLTPSIYEHYCRLGNGQPSKAARETLERAANKAAMGKTGAA
jgi:hypothetical protein